MKQHNVLMIMSDQHRADCVGYVNKYPVKTPNLDKLATEGLWFSNAFTTIPTCCPARQSMLTGKTAENIGGLWNYDITLPITSLPPENDTWTKELKSAGFSLGYIGKWHVNPYHNPLEYGFDYYYGIEDYEKYFKSITLNKSYVGGWQGEEDIVSLDNSRTHIFAQKTIELIKEFNSSRKPWHIRLDFPEPHLPCRPAEPFYSMYSPKDIPKWHNFEDNYKNKPYIQKKQLKNWGVSNYTWKDWAPIVKNYYGSISQCDDAIGKVLDAVEELGIIENTIIIYTSDHGDMGGAHRMVDKHYVMYDDVIQVPLIVRMPKKKNMSNRCDYFIPHTIDLPPTIMEALKLPLPDYFQGRSFLSILNNKPIKEFRENVVASYNGAQFGLFCQRMIRTKNWKYIWNLTDIDELYFLEKDPSELENLTDEKEYQEIQAKLKHDLYQYLIHHKDDILKQSWLTHQLIEQDISPNILPTV